MAQPDNNNNDEYMEEKPSRKKRLLKRIALVILLLILLAGGFFLGIYLRLFDTNEVNEKLGLYDLPIIGEYFVKPAPKTHSDEVSKDGDKKDEPVLKKEESKPVKITKAELEKEKQEREKAEKKRISKLARLYNEMKPEEAADIMNNLEDSVAISILQKMDEGQASAVLAKFDPDKAARITKIMYAGPPKRIQLPGDVQSQTGKAGQ